MNLDTARWKRAPHRRTKNRLICWGSGFERRGGAMGMGSTMGVESWVGQFSVAVALACEKGNRRFMAADERRFNTSLKG
jgi:hypothetical protein